jgi:hypothetical protein
MTSAPAPEDLAVKVSRDVSSAALIRAMTARDFWTAGEILSRWGNGAVDEDLAVAVATSAALLLHRMFPADPDQAVAWADRFLDETIRQSARQAAAA